MYIYIYIQEVASFSFYRFLRNQVETRCSQPSAASTKFSAQPPSFGTPAHHAGCGSNFLPWGSLLDQRIWECWVMADSPTEALSFTVNKPVQMQKGSVAALYEPLTNKGECYGRRCSSIPLCLARSHGRFPYRGFKLHCEQTCADAKGERHSPV